MIFMASLDNLSTIKDFVNLAEKCQQVIIHSDKFAVNGKSLMGIFSLDLSKPVEVEIIDSNENNIKQLRENFEIKERNV